MRKKRFIKLLMSLGAQRDGAALTAELCRLVYGNYAEAWADCLKAARDIVESYAAFCEKGGGA